MNFEDEDDEDDNDYELTPEEFSELSINLEKVVVNNTFLPSTRLLAARLRINPYLTIGEYFKDLSDEDVFKLTDMIDRDDLVEIVALSEMLALAEGNKSENLENCRQYASIFVMLVICESLHRKGLVDVYRENMTFDEQYGSKIVVKARNV